MVPNSQVVVDSSVLVAFYIKADIQHEKAVAVLADLMDATVILHPFVIQETATVITYKVGNSLANKFLRDIQKAKNIRIAPLNVESEMSVFQKRAHKVSFTDVAVINLAYTERAQLLTFDKKMIAVAKTFKAAQ